jgi:hypothetical protein
VGTFVFLRGLRIEVKKGNRSPKSSPKMKYSVFQYKKDAHEIDLERYRNYAHGKIVETKDGETENVPSTASLWDRRDLMQHVADVEVRSGTDLEQMFRMMQHGEEAWTDREFVTAVENPATSLSVGDVLWNRETGEAFVVRKFGFDRIDIL